MLNIIPNKACTINTIIESHREYIYPLLDYMFKDHKDDYYIESHSTSDGAIVVRIFKPDFSDAGVLFIDGGIHTGDHIWIDMIKDGETEPLYAHALHAEDLSFTDIFKYDLLFLLLIKNTDTFEYPHSLRRFVFYIITYMVISLFISPDDSTL